jgi:hypothetical protein
MFLIVFHAVDAVYFNGGNKDGQYMVAATARRHNNIVQTILYLRVCLIFDLFIAIVNNISVILWRSVLLVEETGVP